MASPLELELWDTTSKDLRSVSSTAVVFRGYLYSPLLFRGEGRGGEKMGGERRRENGRGEDGRGGERREGAGEERGEQGRWEG